MIKPLQNNFHSNLFKIGAVPVAMYKDKDGDSKIKLFFLQECRCSLGANFQIHHFNICFTWSKKWLLSFLLEIFTAFSSSFKR